MLETGIKLMPWCYGFLMTQVQLTHKDIVHRSLMIFYLHLRSVCVDDVLQNHF